MNNDQSAPERSLLSIFSYFQQSVELRCYLSDLHPHLAPAELLNPEVFFLRGEKRFNLIE